VFLASFKRRRHPAQKGPIVQFGVMMGRDGAAFGPGLLIEVDPIPRLGLYGFAGRSSVSGYAAGNGILADLSDRTLGVGMALRAFNLGSRFTIGIFGQAAYYGSHVRASYPDGSGGSIQYEDSDKEPLITVGPQVECRVARAIVVFARPGKDFGDNFAAQSAGGFSVNAGVLFRGTSVTKVVGKGFRKLFR
jgi:hypothetical protein